MNLPNEIIIEIFEKIPISNYKQYIKLSRVNKQFNNIYKIHFQEKVKNYNHLFDQYGITDDDIKNLNNKLNFTL